tara:strand:+ start:266 stop:679 length:414 start_codon:yes stop_codon:yes gene_type:complete
MDDDDVFEFREGYWTTESYLVPEGKGIENIQKILKDKQILTKKEWLLNCSLKDRRPREVPAVKQVHGRASFPRYLEWFSVRGWELEETNTIMSNTDEFGMIVDIVDEKRVSKRWCLFKRKFTDRTILQIHPTISEEE